MSEDNKVVETVVSEVKQERVRGDRGELGVPTAGDTIKKMWKEKNHHISLKRYARQLAAGNHAEAKEWLSNKTGALNKERSEKNVARARLEAQATSASRKKKAKPAKNTDATATVVKAK